MSTDNPFAPPKADVADVNGAAGAAQAAPPLWNPRAAAGWSLLFSPLFGSLIHMKNWQALGEPGKATTCRLWAIACAVFIVATAFSVVLPNTKTVDMAFRAVGFALLLGWYYSIGREQNGFVLARYGEGYPRRGWLQPVLLAFAGIAAFVVLIFIVGTLSGTLDS